MSHSAGFLTLLSTYTPTLDKSPEDKDAFYAHISEVIYSVPAGYDLALLEDFNARVLGDLITWRPVLGHFGISSINDNGQCLLESCAAHGLCLPGSFPSGPIRSKVTWMYPGPNIGTKSITLLSGGAKLTLSRGTGACTLQTVTPTTPLSTAL